MRYFLLAVLSASSLTSAHYTFTNLIVDGVQTGYYQHVRITNNHWSHAPCQDVTSNDMRCGGEMIWPANATTKEVKAGATVGFNVEGGLGHPGPLQFYMAQAPAGQDLSSWNGSGEVWFKIASNPPSANKTGLVWPDQFTKNVSVKLPASLPAGKYLFRAEHIGLHAADQVGGAQIYVQCAQLDVSGDGKGVPSPKVEFPGAYKATDPGIKMQLWYPTPTSYVMPGPEVWKG